MSTHPLVTAKDTRPKSPFATSARRAIRQARAARERGELDVAKEYAELAALAIDLHLAAIRADL